ncbi:prolyl aminopeptidase [Embleya sp. NPDC127516]|uniref:prolyl aminopeptidase n=1 Tax=Embleya sp. NPDC127516 TaxID=3363990 RepID=UPI00382AF4B3
MRTMYPAVEPYDQGMLDVGDGQSISWRRHGTPGAKPAVFLHGGPGGGCLPDHVRSFDPTRYDVLLFDQRGCGRSTPHVSRFDTDLSTNTTWHLVADIEKLRELIGVERWLVFGGSWGSTLAPAYAQTHPERCTELVLRGIFTMRRAELAWFYQGGAGMLFPEAWQEFLAPIPEDERGDLVGAFHRRLNDPDPKVREEAALAWSAWEGSLLALLPRPDLVDAHRQREFALAFARIESHYIANAGFLEEGRLIRDADRLRHIPGVIVQGRYDMCTPPATAYDLHRAWPEAELVIVPDAGHASFEPGITHHLIEATDRFAGRDVG